MKNLLKILSFVGALAVGAATVNYFVKPSQSVVSTNSFVADTPAQIINQSIKPVKLSRLEKIEQNYQPKPLEEIPVEFVQIASSDIDEGRKLVQVEPIATTDKVVKVDQGSMFPFSSQNSAQKPVEAQSYDHQMVNPQDYPDFFNNGMNHEPRQNTVASYDAAPASSGSSEAPTVDSAPEEKESKERKNHFRDFSDDMGSGDNTKYTNSSVTPVVGAHENIPQQDINPQDQQKVEPIDNNSIWKNILNALATTAASYLGGKGLEYLYQKLVSNAAQEVSTDKKPTNDQKVPTDQKEILDNFTIEPKHAAGLVGAGLGLAAAAKVQSYMNQKPTQSTSAEPVHSQEQPKSENLGPKARPGITSGSEVQNLLEVSNSVSSIDQSVKQFGSRSGIVETILPEEIIELPAQQEIEPQVNPEIIKLSVQEQVATRTPSYLQTAWNFIPRLYSLSRTITRSAPLALGLLGLSSAPGLIASAFAPAALATTALPAVATTALVPAATTALVPAATGLASYASGAGALMAAKMLVGLGCFAITKNPVFLLPK